MDELYESLYGNNVTIISNKFLDEYLADADPKNIKVFLFYFWKGLKENYTIEETSNEISLSESDIEMALKFWIRKKVFSKECLKREKDLVRYERTENLVDFESKKKELINKNRKDYDDIEQNLLFVAEKLLRQTVSERQQSLIAKCYNEYGFEEGLIHFLFEYCSNKSQTNIKYMSAVASSWYEQGIKTVSEAKVFTENMSRASKNFSKAKKSSKVIDPDEYTRMVQESIGKGLFMNK